MVIPSIYYYYRQLGDIDSRLFPPLNQALITFLFQLLQRASLADKEMSSTAKEEEDTAPEEAPSTTTSSSSAADVGDNCTRTNGAESPPKGGARDADEEQQHPALESRDQRVAKENGGASPREKNDSNNNMKMVEKTRAHDEQERDVEEQSLEQNKEGPRTAPIEVKMEQQEDVDDEKDTAPRQEAEVEELPKSSSFTAELINNIRNNNRNLLGNSHNEWSDEIAGKNKEVSVPDSCSWAITTTTRITTFLITVNGK